MKQGFYIFMGGIAVAMVGTALFAPGRTTVAGIGKLGQAGAQLTHSAEGI